MLSMLSVLIWFCAANVESPFAAIGELFQFHVFWWFQSLYCRQSPSLAVFTLMAPFLRINSYIFFLNSLQYWSAQWFWAIFKSFYLSITVRKAIIAAFPPVTKTMYSFNKLLSPTLQLTDYIFSFFVVYARISWNKQTTKQLSLFLLSLRDVSLCMLLAVLFTSTFMCEPWIMPKHHLQRWFFILTCI